MTIDCSNFLIFKREADFFIYNKCTSYLYTVDYLHYAIASLAQENLSNLSLHYITSSFLEYELNLITDHYNDVVKIFSENTVYDNSLKTYSLQDIMHSISEVPQIVIEVTEECNLHCSYCYYGEMYYNNGKRSANMNTENCISVLRELLSIRSVFYNSIVISFYGGEPLLNINLIRTVVLFCKNEFPNFEYTFSLTTNGTLLLKHIDFLEEYNFRILISLDGDEGDNAFRVYKNLRPSFNDLNYAVKHLFQCHPDYFANNVNFISVLHNKSDIISICKYFSEFNKTPILTMLSLEDINESQQIVYPYHGVSSKEMIQLFSLNQNIYRTIKNATKSKSIVDFEDEISLSPNKNPIRGCNLFSNKIFLSANEQVFLCEKSSRRFPFGDFKKGKLSFYIDSINKYYKSIYDSINHVCSGCSIKMLCKKCFFSEPSLMNCTTTCKLSNSQLICKIINTLKDD